MAAPANDNFVDAAPVAIATNGGTYTSGPVSNIEATTQAGEPAPFTHSANHSCWWRYTPATTGSVTLDTQTTVAGGGGSKDTTLTVYTGATLAALVFVDYNDDGGGSGTSLLTLSVTAGVTYRIQVGAFNGQAMQYQLRAVGPASVPEALPPHALVGAAAATSTATGALTVAHSLTGAAAASSAAAGTLTLVGRVDLTGTGTAVSSASGSLTATGAVIPLAGTGNAVSTTSGGPLDITGIVARTFRRQLDTGSRQRTGRAFADVQIPVTPEPVTIRQQAIPVVVDRLPDPTVTGGVVQPLTPDTLREDTWGRVRIRVGHEDVTYFRDVPALVSDWQLTDPYGHGPATLKFPQISFYELGDFGTGSLDWLAKNAMVDIDHVKAGEYQDTIWSGHIDAFDFDESGALVCDCAGELMGRMDKTHRTQRLVRRVHDAGFLAKIAVAIPNKHYHTPRMGAWDGRIGIDLENTGGGMDTNLVFLDYVLTQSVDEDLQSWTILPVAGKRRHYDLVPRDQSTVDFTVYLGARGVGAQLRDDQTEQPNRLFGEGVAKDGCFPAGTLVRGAKIERGYRRWYLGELVTIRTAGGQELTGTPNHPVLTPHGWVPLGLMEEGFGVFRSGASYRAPMAVDLDVEDVPARIEQVVGALAERGRTQRVGGGVVDLHGEGLDREVDVVDPLGVLRHHRETEFPQPVTQFGFAYADRLGATVHGLRSRQVGLEGGALQLVRREGSRTQGVGLAHSALSDATRIEHGGDAVVADAQTVSDGLSGLAGQVVPADGGFIDTLGSRLSGDAVHLGAPRRAVFPRHPSARCLSACAELNASLSQAFGDGLCVDAQVAADTLGGLSGEITTDYVVNVERTWAGTHVYNLQTGTGAYTAGGLVVHNSRWRGAQYPNLGPEVVPPYPFNDNRTFGADGLADEDTDTGAGISVLEDELVGAGLLSLGAANNWWGPATTEAVEETQRRADLPVTGRVDPDTWTAVFGDGIGQQRLTQGHIMPLVWDPRTERRKLAPNGSFIGLSSVYDEDISRRERWVSFGESTSKPRARRWLRREYQRANGPNWRGTLTLGSDVMAGEHIYGTHGTPMSRMDIRPGMNGLVKRFGSTAGMLMHVSAVSGSGLDGDSPSVQLAVDTQFRDYITLAEMLERDKAARLDPARQWRNQHRRSTTPSDSIIGWDREAGAGHIKHHRLVGGEWNVIPFVAGQSGEIQRIDLATSNNPAEFIMAIFALPVHPGLLNKKIGNPFAVPDGDENIFSKQEVADWLAGTKKKNRDELRADIEAMEQDWDAGIEDVVAKREKRISEQMDEIQDNRIGVYVAGTTEQPCGYWPHVKTNSNGESTGNDVSGMWRDDAGFSFWTLGPGNPFLYLAVFPDRDCTIGGQMYDQLSEGV